MDVKGATSRNAGPGLVSSQIGGAVRCSGSELAVPSTPLVILLAARLGMRAVEKDPLVVLDAGRFGMFARRSLPTESNNALSAPGKVAFITALINLRWSSNLVERVARCRVC